MNYKRLNRTLDIEIWSLICKSLSILSEKQVFVFFRAEMNSLKSETNFIKTVFDLNFEALSRYYFKFLEIKVRLKF